MRIDEVADNEVEDGFPWTLRNRTTEDLEIKHYHPLGALLSISGNAIFIT